MDKGRISRHGRVLAVGAYKALIALLDDETVVEDMLSLVGDPDARVRLAVAPVAVIPFDLYECTLLADPLLCAFAGFPCLVSCLSRPP